jgi:hypothetical protein
MAVQTSGAMRREPATDFELPEDFISRLEDLRALPPGRSDALRNHSASPVLDEYGFEFPSAITVEKRRGLVVFPHTGQAAPRLARFLIEQEFEGMVLSVEANGESFVARLADLTRQGPEEEAEIAFEEISPDDRSLIVPGALFTWSIGRTTEVNGQVRRVSDIRFRRFFRFSPSAIADAEKKAEKMLELLNEGNGG